jgi:hypothetical protein
MKSSRAISLVNMEQISDVSEAVCVICNDFTHTDIESTTDIFFFKLTRVTTCIKYVPLKKGIISSIRPSWSVASIKSHKSSSLYMTYRGF